MFGNPETTPGGLALRFHASIRLEMRRAETMKDGSEITGNRIRVKVAKNKVAPPFRQVEFDMPFGEGISKEGDLLDVAVDQAIIDKSGSWYSYNGERLGQGRNNAKAHLVDHPEVTAEIENKVREIYGLRPQSTTGSIPGDEPNEDKSPEES